MPNFLKKNLCLGLSLYKSVFYQITHQKTFPRFLPSSLGERFGDSAASWNTE